MRKAKAFTLIELLVVIAIIALLMAILIPVLGAVRKQARAIVCRSNQRQWGYAFYMYTEDNNGKFFSNRHFPSVRGMWYYPMRPYWKDCNDILFCPEATKIGGPVFSDGSFCSGGATFLSWAHDAWFDGSSSPYVFACSYGLNALAYDTDCNRSKPTIVGNPGYEFWDTCRVKEAWHVPVFLDSSSPQFSLEPLPCPPLFDGGGGCIDRHDGGINMLFMDWSIRKVGLKELWTLKWHRYFDTAGPWTKAGGARPEDWPEWMRRFRDY